jgi:transcriptional regulator with GAF, ATPase, and Fis domain
LLDLAQSQLNIYHVRNITAVLRALYHDLAPCVILDDDLKTPDVRSLTETIRTRWPAVAIVALVDNRTAGQPDDPLADYYVGRESDVGALQSLLSQIAQRHAVKDHYTILQDRTRHLEGLISGTLTSTGTVEIDAILGDLRQSGRAAVDADDAVVLLADQEYQDLADSLNLGVPEHYLEVCREHFRTLDRLGRLSYLGDEVLLRERKPRMSPNTYRVREAKAAGAASYMRIPITIDQRLVGFVGLFSQVPNRFDGAHLQLGRLFAAGATAIRNQQLYWRLNRRTVSARRQRIARLLAEDLTLEAPITSSEAVHLVSGIRSCCAGRTG